MAIDEAGVSHTAVVDTEKGAHNTLQIVTTKLNKKLELQQIQQESI